MKGGPFKKEEGNMSINEHGQKSWGEGRGQKIFENFIPDL